MVAEHAIAKGTDLTSIIVSPPKNSHPFTELEATFATKCGGAMVKHRHKKRAANAALPSSVVCDDTFSPEGRR
ncbi:hypothetical protein EV560_115127 [Bosea sp. BK604]|nr:hypothetical protein EV560_115127 [Bosea sp. BK604]